MAVLAHDCGLDPAYESGSIILEIMDYNYYLIMYVITYNHGSFALPDRKGLPS